MFMGFSAFAMGVFEASVDAATTLICFAAARTAARRELRLSAAGTPSFELNDACFGAVMRATEVCREDVDGFNVAGAMRVVAEMACIVA
mmetsp:Transcript_47495/g.90682  ORF Transcript_47495/g.90682 Transcript_47495/m.90682 type:complete len:89 (-) Transcript_47495:99-365(-)